LNRYLNNEKPEHTGSNGVSAPGNGQRGFSLFEMLISMAILVLVISLAFDQIMQLQKKTAAESARVDMSQDAREFIDRTVHDLHLAGYPNASMFANASTINPWVAAGIVKVSPTLLLFEGDVNNDGQVYSVNISYVNASPSDPNCPCIRRSATAKTAGDPLSQLISPFYVETAHVMPPGTAPGQSGEDLFAFYDQNGKQLPIADIVDIGMPAPALPGTTLTGQQAIAQIKTIKVNLTLANGVDPNGSPMRTSLSSTVRLNQ
jgi:prepilin-type N-terminal cleavage/methylation domain-containing protein